MDAKELMDHKFSPCPMCGSSDSDDVRAYVNLSRENISFRIIVGCSKCGLCFMSKCYSGSGGPPSEINFDAYAVINAAELIVECVEKWEKLAKKGE